MVASLAKHKAWTDNLDDETRSRIMERLQNSIVHAESPREIASLTRAIAALEQNDLARAKLLHDVESTEGKNEAESLLADLEQMRERTQKNSQDDSPL
jgi:hypothetical protein